ncbi:large ribosomal subunit protein uL13-like [Arctopsyche grandis]|uniref:large ribosomal subunit protein uL13-like n=1 Tax=Arctopsyche grandis TaxID=121162 RepID=UPI00406D92E2
MNRELVIDGTDHVAGKLGAFIAKKALEGYTIHVLCAESLVFTGDMHRHVAAYKSYLNKRNIVNPARGTFHYKEPSKYFRKVFRNMACRKTKRGQAAANRITVYEGIPKQFENVERSIVPAAFRKACTNTERKFIVLGDLLSQFGWHYAALTKSLKEELLLREAAFKAESMKKQEEAAKVALSSSFKKEVEKAMKEFA